MAADPYYTMGNLVPDAFSAEEIAIIESLGDRLLPPGAAAVALPPEPQAVFVYSRLADIAQAVNAQIYHFDIRDFAGHVQYQVERPGFSPNALWRMDEPGGGIHPKLRLIAALSDPSAYAGGALEGHGRPSVMELPSTRGGVIVMPFHTLHRVTPVLSGARKTLSAVISGPRLR